MKRNIGICSLILTILLLLFIWGNSMQNASASTEISTGVLHQVESAAENTAPDSSFTLTDPILRKLGHFAEFGALGITLTLSLALLRKSRRGIYPLALYLGLMTSVIDETIQYFADGRGPRVTDVVLDHAGFCVGLVLTALILHIFFKEKTSKH